MKSIHVETSAVIAARPSQVYAILSDYEVGHPAILPKPFFQELVVEKGGKGAGTVVRVRVKVGGVKQTSRMLVSEPEPGRVLAEVDLDTGTFTTFTLEPLEDGNQVRVIIATDFARSPGFKGFMEKLLTPVMTRPIYKKELGQLAEYVSSKNQNVSVSYS